MAWPSIKFPEAVRKTAVGRENQILSAEIESVGRFPVIDQGQAFIAGYSEAEERVIRDDLPMVIFGDHTRCVKYVDFPFILGADGTKVLKPKEDLLGYTEWRNFTAVISKAKTACEVSQHAIPDHFVDVNKMRQALERADETERSQIIALSVQLMDVLTRNK